jgi:hypothetical protein
MKCAQGHTYQEMCEASPHGARDPRLALNTRETLRCPIDDTDVSDGRDDEPVDHAGAVAFLRNAVEFRRDHLHKTRDGLRRKIDEVKREMDAFLEHPENLNPNSRIRSAWDIMGYDLDECYQLAQQILDLDRAIQTLEGKPRG